LDEKKSFIKEWKQQEASLAELCRRYEISRQTDNDATTIPLAHDRQAAAAERMHG